jgi:PAS domain-containing protein
MQSEAKLAETAGVRDTLARSLDEAKEAWASEVSAAAQRLAARETELTGELARAAAVREALEARVAERDAQLKEQAANHRNSQDALQARTSNHIVQLRRELDDTIVVNRSQFEHAPVSLLRCSRSGGIEQVSQVMATTLGYRTPQEAQAVNFAITVFESPNDWQSFIGRCVETGAESLETIWRRKNGTRFVVRLRAVSHASGHIDVAAEDLTNYRELEEKLRRSERMEAVGRLASEVAATCDNLLRDVRQDGQTWLAAMSDDSPMRQQGELLLDDVTRAASFLRQLDVYSKTHAESSEPADLVRVLRNLTPVLKRVAGDDIEFVLPKSPSELTVDVEKETIERILVNVAAKTTVDSQSVASHPNVRPGPHVLITATAVRYAVWSDASRTLPRPLPANKESEAASDRPGVDLGAMQALIQGCGGRLWLTAEPPGDMVLKIHLPRSTPSHAAVERRPMRRWLHAGR